MPVLSFLVLYLGQLLDQLVSLGYKLRCLGLMLIFGILKLIFELYDLFRVLVILGFGSLELQLGIPVLLLCSCDLLPKLIPVVNVRDALFEHVIH